MDAARLSVLCHVCFESRETQPALELSFCSKKWMLNAWGICVVTPFLLPHYIRVPPSSLLNVFLYAIKGQVPSPTAICGLSMVQNFGLEGLVLLSSFLGVLCQQGCPVLC